ncbi:DUF7311 family protein [Natrialbaceae archaeon A-gly3]
MIRTILAVVLSVAIVALSVPAIDHGASVRTERTLEADLAAIDEEAAALLESEELPPPGQPGPQRTVTVTLSGESLTTASVAYVAIGGDRSTSDDVLVVAYRLEGGPERTVHVDAPVRPDGGDPIVLRGSGEHDLRLTLEPEGDERIIVVSRA